eukprot:s5673_g6.t1
MADPEISKVFRLLSEQKATYTSFSQALLDVLTNRPHLWHDARTTSTLSKIDVSPAPFLPLVDPDQVLDDLGASTLAQPVQEASRREEEQEPESSDRGGQEEGSRRGSGEEAQAGQSHPKERVEADR